MLRPEYYLIDGENLVFRYQAMLKEGRTHVADVVHVQDVLVWHPGLIAPVGDVRRVLYYTSAVGDEARLMALTKQIRTFKYTTRYDETRGRHGYVVPRIFKKPAASQKSRAVDLSIAVDALGAAADGSAGVVVIVSGDSDFIPLVDELMRRGTNVLIEALSSGLSDKLEVAGDHFKLLDDVFFHPRANVELRHTE